MFGLIDWPPIGYRSRVDGNRTQQKGMRFHDFSDSTVPCFSCSNPLGVVSSQRSDFRREDENIAADQLPHEKTDDCSPAFGKGNQGNNGTVNRNRLRGLNLAADFC